MSSTDARPAGFRAGATNNAVSGRTAAWTLLISVLTASCGGGGGGDTGGTPPPPAPTYTISGTVSGLTGSGLILQDNGGDNVTVAANATTFKFATALASGAKYAVTVLASPTGPSETCTVTNGSGTVNGANVTNVAVACTTNSFTIGGSVSGLFGSGLVLQDNSGDNLPVKTMPNQPKVNFTFATPVASGKPYKVTVLTQPTNPSQVCTATNASGTVGASNVTNVIVSCGSANRFVFVANKNDGAAGNGDLSGFKMNTTDGTLTPMTGSPFLVDKTPTAVAVDFSGQFVYVANEKSADVSEFFIDAAGSTLAFHNNYTALGQVPLSIAIAPSNGFLYTGNFVNGGTGAIYGFTLVPDSGALTPLATSPYPMHETPQGIAIDPTGKFGFATANATSRIYVFSIGADGSWTLLANSPTQITLGSLPYGVAVWPQGTSAGGYVYTANQHPGTISAFKYDSTGNLTELSGSPYDAGPQTQGIAIDPAGQYLYVANYGDGTVSNFSINAQTGVLTSLGPDVATGNFNGVPVPPGPGPVDLKVDPSGQFLYVVNQTDGSVSLFTLNKGVVTLTKTYATGSGAISVAID